MTKILRGGASLLDAAASASGYPDDSIAIMVGFSACGGTDR